MKMDKEYWDRFYMKEHTLLPTPFARFCLTMLPNVFPNIKELRSLNICDLGCGNGRDTLLFAREGHSVIAVDQSAVALQKIPAENLPITLLHTEMSELPSRNINSLDIIYSRFSFHAITEAEEEAVLAWAAEALKKDGLLCIEARSDKERFEGDHYRRFANRTLLQQKLLAKGFDITLAMEEKGLAVYNEEDPLIIRIIAVKR